MAWANIIRTEGKLYSQNGRRISLSKFVTKIQTYNVKYGIEAFFAPKQKALAMEHTLRAGAVAILMVDEDGQARLKNVQKKAM